MHFNVLCVGSGCIQSTGVIHMLILSGKSLGSVLLVWRNLQRLGL